MNQSELNSKQTHVTGIKRAKTRAEKVTSSLDFTSNSLRKWRDILNHFNTELQLVAKTLRHFAEISCFMTKNALKGTNGAYFHAYTSPPPKGGRGGYNVSLGKRL